jgi:hypothetical protein
MVEEIQEDLHQEIQEDQEVGQVEQVEERAEQEILRQ